MDWQLTCRVCLETGDMVSLFDWDENNEQLASKYEYCCGVEVSKEDNFPTLICLSCVDRLTFSYQFKQQCLSSNDTLKECLDEFLNTSQATKEAAEAQSTGEKELITVKQENGVLFQYELPVENEPTWTRTLTKSANKAVVSKAPGPKRRGRPRKYPDEEGRIDLSPYIRKKASKPEKEQQSLTSLLEKSNEGADLKEEPLDSAADDFSADDEDPEFNPEEAEKKSTTPRKRGRPPRKEATDDNGDMLLQETILALSEPIPDSVLQPKPKKPKSKKGLPKKKYHYDKTHVCETCGSSFASNASLQAHIRRHLGIKPFVCSVCGYACVMKMELNRHMTRHTGAKPYKCRICERRFGDFGSRQKHESICGYSCVAREALKRHMVRHTGERPYPCRICDRAFGDYGTRQKHERLHMGVRPYTCSVCGKSFTYSYVLSNHMLTHTGEKKYHCAPCNKKFTKAHHLKYHNKVHHKDLYHKQQLEQAAKKMHGRENIKLTNVEIKMPGSVTGHFVDGKLQLVHDSQEIEESDMHVIEESVAEAEGEEEVYAQETDRAVAGMQSEELGSDLYITDDVQ